jgi:hypothetical protein
MEGDGIVPMLMMAIVSMLIIVLALFFGNLFSNRITVVASQVTHIKTSQITPSFNLFISLLESSDALEVLGLIVGAVIGILVLLKRRD